MILPLVIFVMASVVMLVVDAAWTSGYVPFDGITVAITYLGAGVYSIVSFVTLIVRVFRSYPSGRPVHLHWRTSRRHASLLAGAILTNAVGLYFCNFQLCAVLLELNVALIAAWLVAVVWLGKRSDVSSENDDRSKLE